MDGKGASAAGWECPPALNALKTGVICCLSDEKLTFLWGNSAFFSSVHYSEEDYRRLFENLEEYYAQYPEDFALLRQALSRNSANIELTVRLPMKPGGFTWVRLFGSIQEDPDVGGPVFQAELADVGPLAADREEQARLYKQKLGYFHWMMEAYTGNVYVSDMDTYELLYLNPTSCKTLGCPAEKLLGRKCYEVIQGRSSPCPFCTNDKLREDSFYEWEFDNPVLNRTFLIKNRIVEWEGRRARIELSHDMFSTEYKLAKKDREREAMLRSIPGGLARLDARDLSTILWYGAGFLDLIGYTAEQFERELRRQCAYVAPGDMDRLLGMMQKITTTGESIVTDAHLITRGGETRYVTLTLTYASAEDSWDGIPSFYSVGIDVTEERREQMRQRQALEDAMLSAQQANDAKTSFLSRMSHEIRTPLNAIIGMTTIAAASVDQPARVEDCLTKINFSSKHLLMLVNDVLDMAKIESNRLSIQSEPFDLLEVCNRFVSTVYAQSKEKHIDFQEKIEHCGAGNTYVGDPLRLTQILLNLSSNAVKFTASGGAIRFGVDLIASKGPVDTVRFTLSDTGIGMTRDAIERIFEPFEQADATIAGRFGGTGLGMTITKNLVTLMNGQIRVESEPDVGTTCTVDLPLRRVDGDGEEPDFEAQCLRALVVDDEPAACRQAVSILERIKISTESAQSGGSAMERIKETHRAGDDFNLCLIDWKMPDMDGVELTRRIRAYLGQEVPIVLISAYDYTEVEKEARAAGANGFLPKPLYRSAVYAAIKDALGQCPTHEQNADVSQPLAGRRILLAEDNPINQEIAMELLRMNGAEMACADNGAQAVKLFLASQPGYFDAILMDIQMPVMDGHEAARRIRASEHPTASAIPILAVTANAFSDDIAKAKSAGMNGHIAKPIDIQCLLDTLQEWMIKNS